MTIIVKIDFIVIIFVTFMRMFSINCGSFSKNMTEKYSNSYYKIFICVCNYISHNYTLKHSSPSLK